MKLQQVHALRACSLVAIPPSEERMPPPGGFPKDLSCMNLTSWAGLIQDVAQGMKVVPPNLSMEVCLEAMVLLQLLEATTGMGYCRICSQPSPRCRCEDDQYTPTVTWSQMMARMQGQEGAASIGGPTPPGTTTAGVQERGVLPPPPGLQPPDFSKWSLPLPEAPVTGGLPMPSGGPPGIGDQTHKPMGLWTEGPGTTDAGTKRSPGNAAGSSAGTIQACYTFPAGSTVAEPAHCSSQAAVAAIEPACYTIPAGHAATQEVNRKGIVGSTYFRRSHSCR